MSSASTDGHRRGRPGRPRLVPDRLGGSPREQILEASAQLFTSRGFSATSTRDIAEAVGIQQSSVYHHFGNKGGLLQELLAQTVRPTVQQVDEVELLAPHHGWATALACLVLLDLHTLNTTPHNAGMPSKLPDVTNQEACDEFRSIRSVLAAAYHRFAAEIDPRNAAGPENTGAALLHLVEIAIQIHRHGGSMSSAACRSVATAALLLCRGPSADVARTVGDATDLTAQLRRIGGMPRQPTD